MSKPIRELNLELGRPDAAEALRRLAAEVEAARHLGTPPAAGPGPGRGKPGRYLCAAEKIEYPPAYPAADAFASAGFSCPEPPDVLH